MVIFYFVIAIVLAALAEHFGDGGYWDGRGGGAGGSVRWAVLGDSETATGL